MRFNTLMTFTKQEIKLNIREMSSIIFGVIFPILLMLFFGMFYGDKVDSVGVRSFNTSIAAVMTIGICAFGLMGIPLTMASYREKKVLKRFMVTPISPLVLLSAQFLCAFILTSLAALVVVALAILIFGFSIGGSWIEFLGGYILVLLPIFSMGLLIGSITKNINQVNILASLIYFPTFLLSGATVPYEILPKPIQVFSSIMPLNHGIKLLKGIVVGESMGDNMRIVYMLLAVFIICAIVSIRTFRYDYE